jgi:hypothetical protein
MFAKLQTAAPIGCKATSILVGNGVNHSYRYNFSLVFFDLFFFSFCSNIATKYVCQIARGCTQWLWAQKTPDALFGPYGIGEYISFFFFRLLSILLDLFCLGFIHHSKGQGGFRSNRP